MINVNREFRSAVLRVYVFIMLFKFIKDAFIWEDQKNYLSKNWMWSRLFWLSFSGLRRSDRRIDKSF